MNIAKEIRRIRKAAGLTQKELAKKIKRDRSMVAHYELGDSIPPGDILLKIWSLKDVSLPTMQSTHDTDLP